MFLVQSWRMIEYQNEMADKIPGIRKARSLTLRLNGGSSMTKSELIELVQSIIDCEGSEEDQERRLTQLEESVLDPNVSDLIYWPDQHPGNHTGHELSAKEIVEIALSYKPIITPPPEPT